MNFKDGSTATCDILVGADGLKSATRKAMFEKLADAEPVVEKANALRELIEPKWAGQYIYKNLISKEKLAAICPDHPALGAPAIVRTQVPSWWKLSNGSSDSLLASARYSVPCRMSIVILTAFP